MIYLFIFLVYHTNLSMSKKWGRFFLKYYKTITSKKQPLYFFLIMAALIIQFFHILYSLTGGIFLFDLPVPKSLFYFIFDITQSL